MNQPYRVRPTERAEDLLLKDPIGWWLICWGAAVISAITLLIFGGASVYHASNKELITYKLNLAVPECIDRGLR
jgi:hypothetical protein